MDEFGSGSSLNCPRPEVVEKIESAFAVVAKRLFTPERLSRNKNGNKTSKHKKERKPRKRKQLFVRTICKTEFVSKDLLYDHVKESHSDEFPFPCDTCKMRFAQAIQLEAHQVIHDPKRFKGEPQFQCDFCDKRYYLYVSMILHRKIKHLGYKRPPKVRNGIPKIILPKKKHTEKLRENSHASETSYDCDVCEQSFNSYSSFIDHATTIHKDSSTIRCPLPTLMTKTKPRWKCEVCGRQCQTSSKLKVHMTLHTGERVPGKHPFEMNNEILKDNVPTLTYDKSKAKDIRENGIPLDCDTSSLYTEFGLLESSTPPDGATLATSYQCTLCPNMFSSSGSLKFHVLRNHRIKKLYSECSLCGIFTLKANFHRHLRSNLHLRNESIATVKTEKDVSFGTLTDAPQVTLEGGYKKEESINIGTKLTFYSVDEKEDYSSIDISPVFATKVVEGGIIIKQEVDLGGERNAKRSHEILMMTSTGFSDPDQLGANCDSTSKLETDCNSELACESLEEGRSCNSLRISEEVQNKLLDTKVLTLSSPEGTESTAKKTSNENVFIRGVKSTSKQPKKCPVCSMTLSSMGTLNRHIRRKHNQLDKSRKVTSGPVIISVSTATEMEHNEKVQWGHRTGEEVDEGPSVVVKQEIEEYTGPIVQHETGFVMDGICEVGNVVIKTEVSKDNEIIPSYDDFAIPIPTNDFEVIDDKEYDDYFTFGDIEIPVEDEPGMEIIPARKRGRPRKHPHPCKVPAEDESGIKIIPGGKRGRPRKYSSEIPEKRSSREPLNSKLNNCRKLGRQKKLKSNEEYGSLRKKTSGSLESASISIENLRAKNEASSLNEVSSNDCFMCGFKASSASVLKRHKKTNHIDSLTSVDELIGSQIITAEKKDPDADASKKEYVFRLNVTDMDQVKSVLGRKECRLILIRVDHDDFDFSEFLDLNRIC